MARPSARDDRRGRRRDDGEVPRGRGADRGRAARGDPSRHHRRQAHSGAHRFGVQEQGRPAHARRRRGLPPQPARRARGRGPQGRRRGDAHRSQAEQRRAVRRAGLQDHDRPAPRQAHLHPGLLRRPRVGHRGAQLGQGPQGAHRQDLPDAREQARGDLERRRRRHRRRHGSQGHHHGRDAVRRQAARSCSSR